ncbi:MAG TPA: ribose-phosphate pyrophosphokinase [Gaiellaceae bacterium]|nr:ribose-phosphate pyrophosphokinase [Gaiellaceae bacterium]
MRGGRLLLFAGRSHPALAATIAGRLGVPLGRVELETFTDGEVYCRYAESVRGADVFLLQSCWPDPNDRLVELLVMVDAARLASAHRITAVMPWFPYSRQDKKLAPREPISARLVADLLEAGGVDRVLTMDLHAGQIQGFFHIPVDHMTALPLFAEHFRERGLHGGNVVSVSPDLGRVKQARRVSHMLDCGFAVVAKTRPAHEVAVAAEVFGDVGGKTALIGDDLVVTGGTLLAAGEALRAAGADGVCAFATHALFAPGAVEALVGRFEELAVTDTVPIAPDAAGGLTVLSVAGLLADTIRNVVADSSVSAIFAGLNELF